MNFTSTKEKNKLCVFYPIYLPEIVLRIYIGKLTHYVEKSQSHLTCHYPTFRKLIYVLTYVANMRKYETFFNIFFPVILFEI